MKFSALAGNEMQRVSSDAAAVPVRLTNLDAGHLPRLDTVAGFFSIAGPAAAVSAVEGALIGQKYLGHLGRRRLGADVPA